MRVLVTGGSGYVGVATCQELQRHGHEVWVYDQRPVPAGEVSPRRVRDRLDELPTPDAIIHLAASTSVPESARQPLPYYRNNVVETVFLATWARDRGVTRMVLASSAAVYLPTSSPPLIPEGSPTSPTNPYGQTKRICEQLLADCVLAGDLRSAVCLRYFNVAGAILQEDFQHGYRQDPPQHILPRAVHCGATGGVLPMRSVEEGYHLPVRDFVHVADVARANRLAAELDREGCETFNICSGQPTSIWQLLRRVEEASGLRVQTELVTPEDFSWLAGSPERAATGLGWTPEYSLEDIVRSEIEWYTSLRDKTREVLV